MKRSPFVLRTLSMDLEAVSPISLAASSVYAYPASLTSFFLFDYSIGQQPPRVANLKPEQRIPAKGLRAVVASSVVKTTFNETFKRVYIPRLPAPILSPLSRTRAVLCRTLSNSNRTMYRHCQTVSTHNRTPSRGKRTLSADIGSICRWTHI